MVHLPRWSQWPLLTSPRSSSGPDGLSQGPPSLGQLGLGLCPAHLLQGPGTNETGNNQREGSPKGSGPCALPPFQGSAGTG